MGEKNARLDDKSVGRLAEIRSLTTDRINGPIDTNVMFFGVAVESGADRSTRVYEDELSIW